jgi:hypothetical protein
MKEKLSMIFFKSVISILFFLSLFILSSSSQTVFLCGWYCWKRCRPMPGGIYLIVVIFNEKVLCRGSWQSILSNDFSDIINRFI